MFMLALFTIAEIQKQPNSSSINEGITCKCYVCVYIYTCVCVNTSDKNSKWIKDLNARPEIIKILEEIIDKTLFDINHSKILYDPPPRVMEIKTKIDKLDLIKLKSFCTAKKWSESCSVVSDPLWPHGLFSPWNSPNQNTGVRSLSLLQGIFPTQGSNPGPPHCRQILYQLSHQGSPRILEWVAYPFSRGSSRPRNQTGISCIAGRFFTSWATREVWEEKLPWPGIEPRPRWWEPQILTSRPPGSAFAQQRKL